MSKFSRRVRNAMGQAPKPAWIHCPGQRAFCCCFTIRTGASVIGWFNFIFNSLYVGMLVFALARTKENLSQQMEFIKGNFDFQKATESSGSELNSSLDLHWRHGTSAFLSASFSCDSSDNKKSCVCNPESYTALDNDEEIDDCTFLPDEYPHTECLCDLGKILFDIIPMMYKSLGIPGFMILLSILWLTAVESNSIRFLRWVGYLLMPSILIQIILQFYYQIFANKKFVEGKLGSLHGAVWAVYCIYALLNLYFIPVLHRYIILRRRECAQGIEQGLLTSERHPPSNQALDVYLEDAFAIDSDADADRVCYAISGSNDRIEENYLSSNTTLEKTAYNEVNDCEIDKQDFSTFENQPMCDDDTEPI